MSGRSKIAAISNKGTKTTIFDKKGRAVLLEHEQVLWTDEERAAILEASAVIEAEFGRQEYPAESGKVDDMSDYSYARFLPITEYRLGILSLKILLFDVISFARASAI